MNLLRIKWEVITTIIMEVSIIIMDINIFRTEGFNLEICVLEILLNALVVYGWYNTLKMTRKGLLEEYFSK